MSYWRTSADLIVRLENVQMIVSSLSHFILFIEIHRRLSNGTSMTSSIATIQSYYISHTRTSILQLISIRYVQCPRRRDVTIWRVMDVIISASIFRILFFMINKIDKFTIWYFHWRYFGTDLKIVWSSWKFDFEYHVSIIVYLKSRSLDRFWIGSLRSHKYQWLIIIEIINDPVQEFVFFRDSVWIIFFSNYWR